MDLQNKNKMNQLDSPRITGGASKKDSKKGSKKDSKPKKQPKEKIYCGPQEPIPKPYNKYGSMKECHEKNQVKRYGLYKIDSKLLKSTKNKEDKITLLKKKSGLLGKVSKYKRLLKNPKLTKTESQKLKDEANVIIREIKELDVKINKL